MNIEPIRRTAPKLHSERGGVAAPVMAADFPSGEKHVAEVRRWMRGGLLRYGVHDVEHAALLVLSEVVTNVVRHTSSKRFTVRVDLSDGVEVAVHDSDPTMPKVRAAQSSDESGRGMVMVQALADDWGVHAVTGGKWVWFRLSRDFPAAA